ncbi:hypothetical protein EJB05_26284, partial [Eragrostis curvula]
MHAIEAGLVSITYALPACLALECTHQAQAMTKLDMFLHTIYLNFSLSRDRYFIVIDDIWENESWEETIEWALLENSGSRIIITTRNSTVAEKISDEHTADASIIGMLQLRSFISYRCAVDKLALLSSFKHLRVLDMEDCNNLRSSHLVHLGSLLHLRYLGMQNTDVQRLPNEIGALKLLQTLNLDSTYTRHLTPNIS